MRFDTAGCIVVKFECFDKDAARSGMRGVAAPFLSSTGHGPPVLLSEDKTGRGALCRLASLEESVNMSIQLWQAKCDRPRKGNN